MEAQVARIYHPWHQWEDYYAGFYERPTGSAKTGMIEKAVEMFSSAGLTKTFMDRVVSEWPRSCEHNLSNPSMNRIAYLGQGACCIYASVPSSVTMEAWSHVPKAMQDQADSIALEVLTSWIKTQK